MKYIIVYPETHKHLGLFEDLNENSDVVSIVASQKNIKSKIYKRIKKIHLSGVINRYIKIPFKRIWYKPIKLDIKSNEEYCVIIVDAALRSFDITYLNNIISKENVRGVLVLINSLGAHSTSMIEIKSLIPKICWNDVYTFDPIDEKKYGYKPLQGAYYSLHNVALIKENYKEQFQEQTDVYFVGGLKGNREDFIISLFGEMERNTIKADFNILITGERRLHKKKYENKINYYSGGWISYEKVLAGILNSNVIIEILQDGQHGPSLRYYEAVCYNKKLLTTNKKIANLPYYDERYMKIISDIEDIDIEWIKQKESIDYGYRGEFSPQNILKVVLQ
ncbi:hypothetical protein [Clostridium saudiense]|uniref:hypothetical protein n=1 Tax=Clostridium saudiense TaxID=1414720 RepID=UPI00266EEAF4|nr:hypothetical protein [Clostridium saudiense]